MMSVKITRLPASAMREGMAWEITKDGKTVGLIQKTPNTKTDIHPFKVFARLSPNASIMTAVGFFYRDKDAARIGDVFEGETGGLAAAKEFAQRFAF